MGEIHRLAFAGADEYLPSQSFPIFLRHIAARHPRLAALIGEWDPAWLAGHIAELNALSWEFEDGANGRGVHYNAAQKIAGNRAAGMARLLQMFSPDGAALPGPETVILDALAGDGTVTRFAQTLPSAPTILSADISAMMIEACLAQGLPCIRQSAAQSLLRDGVLDGVLIAYGSHHLPHSERRTAAAEARRTLRPGGRFVLHDFETGGPVDAFFRDVVHPFSATGHPHPHFSRAEMTALLTGAGFDAVSVIDMDDPFVIPGATEDAARAGMLAHLWHMYGLVKLDVRTDSGRADLEARVRATLGPIEVCPSGAGWVAHLARTALVATGTA